MSAAPEASPAKPSVHVCGWKSAAHSWSSAATPLRNSMRVHAGPRYGQGLPPKNCKPALQTWTLLRNSPWARVWHVWKSRDPRDGEGQLFFNDTGLLGVVREGARELLGKIAQHLLSLCVCSEKGWSEDRVPLWRVHGGGLLGYLLEWNFIWNQREEGFLFCLFYYDDHYFCCCCCKSRGKVSIITTWFYLFLGVQEEYRWGERYRMFLSPPERKHPTTHSWL